MRARLFTGILWCILVFPLKLSGHDGGVIGSDVCWVNGEAKGRTCSVFCVFCVWNVVGGKGRMRTKRRLSAAIYVG